MPEYEVTVIETRIYRGKVSAPAPNVALDMIADAVVEGRNPVVGFGFELPLVEVKRGAEAGDESRSARSVWRLRA